MKKIGTGYILVLLGLLMANGLFGSDRIPVRELFDNADRYEGQKVTIIGEVIGDIMRDGKTSWVNINDGDFLIGAVILDESLLGKIKKIGRYRVHGDTVRISGFYQTHCREHLGERDIHVEALDVVTGGYELEDSIDLYEVIVSILLAVATLIFVFHTHGRNVRKDSAGQHD